MSRGSERTRAELLAALTRELQQFQGLGTSYVRAAAGSIGLTATDVEVLERLAAMGPTTAGQLAELTGLTTGAITGMLNRLEEAKLVRRERDPADGRRVIVHLATGTDAPREMLAIFDAVRKRWGELASRYDDEQIAFLTDFLRRGSDLYRQEVVWLRAAPADQEGAFSAPLTDVASGQLVVTGAARLTLRADASMSDLYSARFDGPVPEVKATDGVVAIRYPRRLWILSSAQTSAAEVRLNTSIPWRISIQGGAAKVSAELGNLTLTGLEVKGGMSMISIELPAPVGVVPVLISGGASEITIRRPAGSAARVHLKGWVSMFTFDDQTFSDMGSDVRLQSRGFDAAAPSYDIEVASSASIASITAE